MNELENQQNPIEQPAAQTGQPDSTPAPEAQEVKTAENVEPAPATEVVAEVKAEADATEEADAPAWKRYHDMTKDELLAEMTDIVENNKMDHNREAAALKQAYHNLRAKEVDKELADYMSEHDGSTEGFASTPDPTEELFRSLQARFKEGRTAFLEEQEKVRRENLEKKQEVIDQIKAIIDDIDNINLHFPKFVELQNRFKEIKDIPETAETAIWKEYQQLVEKFYDHLKVNKELRDLDFKKNMEAKRGLIEEAKALVNVKDVISASRRLQDLHNQWREIGPVAKEYRDSIWEEFREASTVIRKAHQEFFEGKKARELENETAKVALCEEIEAIDYSANDSFSAWDATTKAILDLQERWKKIGFASRKVNSELYARFRQACDAFFTAKAEYYKKAKEDMAANLARKEALCEQAEALKDAENKREAAEKVRALKEEWRTIGSVARKYSDAVWQRFNAACNEVFKDRLRRISEVRETENANLKLKKDIIEQLKAIDPETADRQEAGALVRSLQKQWQEIGHVPFKLKDTIYEEYRALCDKLYEALDITGRKSRMNAFRSRVEKLETGGGVQRERERLQRALEQKEAELKTYENNIGFFKFASASDNPLLKEAQRNAERIKADMADLKSKIAMLDKKED